MRTLLVWVVGGFVAIVVITGMIPTIESALSTFIVTASTAILTIAPKAAVLLFVLGFVLACFHWTRSHARKMIFWSMGLAVACAAATAVFGWLSAETATFTPTATGLASSILERAASGLSSGLHG